MKKQYQFEASSNKVRNVFKIRNGHIRLLCFVLLVLVLFGLKSLKAQTFYVSLYPSCDSVGQLKGAIYASITGGAAPYSYKWSTGSTAQFISGLSNGFYSIMVNDSKGMMDSAAVIVNCSTIPSLIVTATSQCFTDSFGMSKGSANAGATGGVSPYTYKWSNGKTGSGIYFLTNATYTVTVTDAKGITSTSSVIVNCSTKPSLIATATSQCFTDSFGVSNGTANASATGGVSPYTYKWSNGASSSVVYNVVNSTYTITVVDAKGNSATTTVSVNCKPAATGVSNTFSKINGINVYPNPAINTIYISYMLLGSNLMLNLEVYDMLGKKVAELENQMKPGGEYYERFDVTQLIPGMYFVKLSVDGSVSTTRIVVQK